MPHKVKTSDPYKTPESDTYDVDLEKTEMKCKRKEQTDMSIN